MVRKNFDLNLKQLKDNLSEMAEAAKQSVNKSIEALKVQDLKLAEEVIELDATINSLENKINEQAIIMIAKEAPVASDLRKIIVAIKVSSDIERIGDLAVNIAKSTLIIGDDKLIKPIEEIPKMMNLALDMLQDVLTAFDKEDITLARQTAEKDDAVDEMYGKLVKELMHYIPLHPKKVNQITQLSFICRYIERIGDHVTNIAENIIYLVTGNRYDLNS